MKLIRLMAGTLEVVFYELEKLFQLTDEIMNRIGEIDREV